MVDRAKIIIKAGKGGDGVVHFRRARFIPKGGPDGGDGGRGGSVYMGTDTNLSTLDHFTYKQRFEAASGRPGGGTRSSGAAGDDLYLKVPIGTVVRLLEPQSLKLVKEIDFDKEGMEILIAKGGRGGKGNWHFKSPTNTTPREAMPGGAGEEWQAEIDLKILADVGLVGLPNVGKSTLLSILTKARPKIADYEFTTLEANLGVTTYGLNRARKSLVLADIPGLIEGASEGKGLGIQFLRHIERTTVLVHLLALKNGQENLAVGQMAEELINDYETIRKELTAYGAGIEKKKEVVVLNKIDLVDSQKLVKLVAALAKRKLKVMPISGGTLEGVEDLRKAIFLLAKK